VATIARVVNIAIVSEGAVLLVRRALTDSLPGVWEIPGGAVEPGESFDHAARRELAEETGIGSEDLVEAIRLTGPAPPGFHTSRIEVGVFRASVQPRPMVTLRPREHSDHQWARPGQLKDITMMDLNRSLALIACAELQSLAPARSLPGPDSSGSGGRANRSA
jgi:8-oxo-dGTP diphosphatase